MALALPESSASHTESASSIPLLVTVDDLPLTGGDLHADPAERARITRGMLAALAAHEVPAVGLVLASVAMTVVGISRVAGCR